jgi:hypothetical protein
MISKRWRPSYVSLGILLVASVLVVIGPVDWARRYLSLRQISKNELVDSANWYVESRAPGNDACLYAVQCTGGRASLKLIRSLDDWDIEATKQITWDRKFRGVCNGRTANFALELATDNPQSDKTPEGVRHAVWSFYNDRFVPRLTRFESAAFSETEVEPCLAAYAITGRRR